MNMSAISSELLIAERDILTRVAEGGPIADVLRDIILLVEKPSKGEMLTSILFVSDDGQALWEGAAPSLSAAYNAAIHGIPIGNGIGSCGTAAATGEAVIVADIASDPLWTDFCDLALSHGLRAYWSIPIKASDGRVLGTFANYYREPREPSERDLEVISMVARTTAIAIERHLNELARDRAEEQRQLVLRELNHRVKNIFPLVQSLLVMSARSATTVPDYAEALQGRLNALARAHELIQPELSLERPPEPNSVSVRQILQDILAPYVREDFGERIRLAGGDEQISASAITGISLIFHELATNAAKHGALSNANGRLSVTWRQSAVLEIDWQERGAPAVSPPTRSGFGSTLTQRTVERQFHGTVQYDWLPVAWEYASACPLKTSSKVIRGAPHPGCWLVLL